MGTRLSSGLGEGEGHEDELLHLHLSYISADRKWLSNKNFPMHTTSGYGNSQPVSISVLGSSVFSQS